MTTRVTIVGAGKIGSKHASVLHSMRGTEVAHVVDVNAEAAKRTAEAVNADRSSLNEALVDTDAVYVCTPDADHAEITRDAIDAGVHTLVEKPLATDPEAARELVAMAEESKAVHMVGHVLRFDTRYRRLKQAVNDEEFGRICAVMTKRLVRRERVRRTGGDSHPAMRLGVHDFDVVEWLTDEKIVAVTADGADGALNAEGYDVEDVVTVTAEFESGATATMTLGFCLPDGHPGSVVDATVVGTNRFARLDAGEAATQVWGANGGSYLDTHLWPTVDGRPAGALERESRRFVDAVQTGDPSPVPFTAGHDAVAVAAAVEMALTDNKRVPIERSR